jgi:hypothetical protein
MLCRMQYRTFLKLPERSPQTAKTKLAQHIYHVHMIPLPGDYQRRGRGWTHLSDKPSEFVRNVRALVNVIRVDHVHRYGY